MQLIAFGGGGRGVRRRSIFSIRLKIRVSPCKYVGIFSRRLLSCLRAAILINTYCGLGASEQTKVKIGSYGESASLE